MLMASTSKAELYRIDMLDHAFALKEFHFIGLLHMATLKFAVFCCSATLMRGPKSNPSTWGSLETAAPVAG